MPAYVRGRDATNSEIDSTMDEPMCRACSATSPAAALASLAIRLAFLVVDPAFERGGSDAAD